MNYQQVISGVISKQYKNLEVFVVVQLMFVCFWDMKLLQIPRGYFDLSRTGLVASKFRDPIFPCSRRRFVEKCDLQNI